jgi:hypothetical protein
MDLPLSQERGDVATSQKPEAICDSSPKCPVCGEQTKKCYPGGNAIWYSVPMFLLAIIHPVVTSAVIGNGVIVLGGSVFFATFGLLLLVVGVLEKPCYKCSDCGHRFYEKASRE